MEGLVQPSFRILFQHSVLPVEKRERGPTIQYYVGQPIVEWQQLRKEFQSFDCIISGKPTI